LIHVHNRPLLAHYLKERCGSIPVILHMHNLNESLGKREKPRPGLVIPLEGFVACSRFVLERESARLGAGAPLRRVVYNGVEMEAFASRWKNEALVSRVRESHQLSDEPTVLFAGKLREAKGVHVLLAAMDRVWQVMPQAVLVLVGGTEYGRHRTMRETPFLKSCADNWPRPGAGWSPPALSPRRRCPGLTCWGTSSWAPPRSKRAWAWSFWRPRPAVYPSSPAAGGASPRWCGTARPACCWRAKTTPRNWLTRSPTCSVIETGGKAWGNTAGNGC